MKDNRRKYVRDEQTQIRSIEEKKTDDRKRSDESEMSKGEKKRKRT